MRRVVISSLLCLSLFAGMATADSRDEQWQQVEEAIGKGLPQTAIGILEQIAPAAIADEAYAEAIKALGLKVSLEGEIQGSKAEERILRWEVELAQAPEPMEPVMEAILAHWYWQYFQQNRWRFMQRTQTAQPPGEDITTWDLARILAEIDKHFLLALDAAAELQSIDIREYDDLLVKGTAPDAYRPTLYDFIVFEALAFYSTGEQGATLSQDAFEFLTDSPIFAPIEEFLQWEPQTTDQDSVKLRAIHLYQDLLAFHLDDPDPSALIDADLHRLNFGNNFALGPDKARSYQAALEHIAQGWEGHVLAASARYYWANSLYTEGDYVAAHTVAQRGADLHPKSDGGQRCQILIHRIEAPSATIHTERVWNNPYPDLELAYRNVTKVYFRIYGWDFKDYPKHPHIYGYTLPRDERDLLLATDPLLSWEADLPATPDYQERTELLPVPSTLSKGIYLVVASHDPSFTKGYNKISASFVWVSDLALVMRSLGVKIAVEGFVRQAESGLPVAQARVTRWIYKGSSYHRGDTTTSDADGWFRFDQTSEYQNFILEVESGEDRLMSGYDYRTSADSGHRGSSSVYRQTVFFTDRALYRPGQTVRYKGICIQRDTQADDYRTLPGESVTVRFTDANGQEITQQVHRCNDYGSFSGSFRAPLDRLPGRMNISTTVGPRGYVSVQVEEYKRPSFRVVLEAPDQAPKLDNEVEVPGLATAYTGAAIGGAEVTWRVTRTVRFPRWCRRCRYSPTVGQAQVIAYGSTVTATDGSFAIPFTAKPDLAILPEDEPVFSYQIHADVTDPTGETRSADRALRIGYTALQATVSAESWQTPDAPVALTVTTLSLDGLAEPASGTVAIYTLQEPDRVIRKPLLSDTDLPDASDPQNWDLGAMLAEYGFQTDALGQTTMELSLAPGIYRALLVTQDRFGKAVRAEHTLQVVDPQQATYSIPIANHVSAPSWSVEPGTTFTALWGTGYESGRAFIELENRGEVLRAWWTDVGRTQELISEDVTESLRGGFTLRITYVRENRAYVTERIVDVPWTNKKLTIRWDRFRSLLEPGQAETWTAIITGPDARRAVAEMVATLYDASLDQFLPHTWLQALGGFRRESSRLTSRFENFPISFSTWYSWYNYYRYPRSLSYRHFPQLIRYPNFYFGGGSGGGGRGGRAAPEVADGDTDDKNNEPEAAADESNLENVTPRKNLDETAFFFPHLVSNREGEVRMEFTMPEALTEWRFMGFAHDNELRSGFLADSVVTAKDLMVQPNAPRFVREGDTIEFTVKVTNLSAARQTGHVALHLSDARTGGSRDAVVGNQSPQQTFDVPSKESRTYAWRLTIPDGSDYLTYKAVGATDRLSDGEEGYLPVLSRRILVIESLPLPIRGAQTKEFEFTKLKESGNSDTLQHQSLTLQMVSQPAWYAVMALPYLMEQTRESSLAIFTRLYANSLGAYIANSDPEIRRVFDQWKATPTLDSPLEQNEDLKAIALEETPWVHQAVRESEARRNVGILFDGNRLVDEMSRARFKLEQRQYASGLWPWYPGLRGNEYITLNIVTGYGRLRHLGLRDLDVGPAIKALNALDAWMDSRYRLILRHGNPDHNNLSSLAAYYLYGRSFFLGDQAVDAAYQEALDFWLGQAQQYWLSQPRQTQAHLALGLKRFGYLDTPGDIMRSIKEFSVTDEELGMYWRDTERSWWWYRAPIETQALMIEAFDEVMGDDQAVEDCRVWLLKQKQTQDWKTNRATADAVYGLLLRGANMLGSHALVEVALGGQWIEPENVEVGTGFYEERFLRNEIQPSMGEITVKKVDEGVSWGSIHWQYLEDMSKVTPYEGTPLRLEKALYVKRNTGAGPTLFPVDGSLFVGDELVVRIVLRVDRDMEYMHLKDQRGSGTEPVNVLSRYRYQDGLAYYETTRDTASHFYMDYLPKGVYVFEYSTRVQHRGQYQSGIATIQCLYAPEFNSHSESFELTVD